MSTVAESLVEGQLTGADDGDVEVPTDTHCEVYRVAEGVTGIEKFMDPKKSSWNHRNMV